MAWMFWGSLLLLVAMVSLAEALLHYFPWRLILYGEDLRPPWTYALGTGAIVGPLSVWMVIWKFNTAVLALWVAVGAAGATVLLLYLLDWVLDIRMKLRESSEREELNVKK